MFQTKIVDKNNFLSRPKTVVAPETIPTTFIIAPTICKIVLFYCYFCHFKNSIWQRKVCLLQLNCSKS